MFKGMQVARISRSDQQTFLYVECRLGKADNFRSFGGDEHSRHDRIDPLAARNLLPWIDRSTDQSGRRKRGRFNRFFATFWAFTARGWAASDGVPRSEPVGPAWVFAAIVAYLQTASAGPKLFITRNTKDFADPRVQEELEQFECKLLTRFEDAVGYLAATLSLT